MRNAVAEHYLTLSQAAPLLGTNRQKLGRSLEAETEYIVDGRVIAFRFDTHSFWNFIAANVEWLRERYGLTE